MQWKDDDGNGDHSGRRNTDGITWQKDIFFPQYNWYSRTGQEGGKKRQVTRRHSSWALISGKKPGSESDLIVKPLVLICKPHHNGAALHQGAKDGKSGRCVEWPQKTAKRGEIVIWLGGSWAMNSYIPQVVCRWVVGMGGTLKRMTSCEMEITHARESEREMKYRKWLVDGKGKWWLTENRENELQTLHHD